MPELVGKFIAQWNGNSYRFYATDSPSRSVLRLIDAWTENEAYVYIVPKQRIVQTISILYLL